MKKYGLSILFLTTLLINVRGGDIIVNDNACCGESEASAAMPTYEQIKTLWEQIANVSITNDNMTSSAKTIPDLEFIRFDVQKDVELEGGEHGDLYDVYFGINIDSLRSTETEVFFSASQPHACGIAFSYGYSDSGFSVYFKDRADAENYLSQLKQSKEVKSGDYGTEGIKSENGWYCVSLVDSWLLDM